MFKLPNDRYVQLDDLTWVEFDPSRLVMRCKAEGEPPFEFKTPNKEKFMLWDLEFQAYNNQMIRLPDGNLLNKNNIETVKITENEVIINGYRYKATHPRRYRDYIHAAMQE